jgi:hypothetical protein
LHTQTSARPRALGETLGCRQRTSSSRGRGRPPTASIALVPHLPVLSGICIRSARRSSLAGGGELSLEDHPIVLRPSIRAVATGATPGGSIGGRLDEPRCGDDPPVVALAVCGHPYGPGPAAAAAREHLPLPQHEPPPARTPSGQDRLPLDPSQDANRPPGQLTTGGPYDMVSSVRRHLAWTSLAERTALLASADSQGEHDDPWTFT